MYGESAKVADIREADNFGVNRVANNQEINEGGGGLPKIFRNMQRVSRKFCVCISKKILVNA